MSNDKERIAKLTAGAARMGTLAIYLERFASEIIAFARRRRLTRHALDEIRTNCIRDAKNAGVAGLPIEQEAEMLGQLIEDLDKMTERAIAKGWQSDDR
jgi:hypothetical protein